MDKAQLSIVWFKRDLRIHDHAPLSLAAKQGAVLPLYVIEPEFWQQPDASKRHWLFIKECLQSLDDALKNLGQPLIVKEGSVVDVLAALNEQFSVQAIYAHEECGNAWTYQRDLDVIAWCKQQSIAFNETPANGVVRRLNSRDDWSRLRDERIEAEVVKAPPALTAIKYFEGEHLTSVDVLPSQVDDILGAERQRGGRHEAIQLLNSFFKQRGQSYTRSMSSPNSAFFACSRLSPHIVNGTISIREVTKALHKQRNKIQELPEHSRKKWSSSLKSFESRLYWRCHFVQKLEDQPSIEYQNLHSAFDGMRDSVVNREKFVAWSEGRTGYPMVDACMRALIQTGWINFRMRAMLVSFASYHLWLHWQETAWHLARLFVDYEPGIHYSQIQMQSGTTGMNIPRMYNPVKQSQDHDPDGTFIRRYIPELANIPASDIHEPWLIPPMLQTEYACIIGEDYPAPIVDLKVAIAYARQQIGIARKKAGYKTESKRLVAKHASRKPSKRKGAKKVSRKQLSLGFD